MKQIDPIRLMSDYFEDIEKEVLKVFVDVLYIPLLDAMSMRIPEIKNSSSILAAAVRKGTVWHDGNRFYGQFNSKISKELRKMGATYDKRSKSWYFNGTLPPEISSAQVFAVSQYNSARASAVIALDKIAQNSVLTDSLNKAYQKTVKTMDKDIYTAASRIMIPPQITDDARDIIAKEWSDNMELHIKGWLDKNIKKLRDEIEGNVFKGNRAESLVAHITRSYQVSERKAKSLARQETSLLMSKFREQRYKTMGSYGYKWSTSGDGKVRDDHKDLEGKVVRWDDPPIVDKKSGRRAHAGEDFGCRCVAIPLFK